MSKKCPHCGAEMADTASFCIECGSKFPPENNQQRQNTQNNNINQQPFTNQQNQNQTSPNPNNTDFSSNFNNQNHNFNNQNPNNQFQNNQYQNNNSTPPFVQNTAPNFQSSGYSGTLNNQDTEPLSVGKFIISMLIFSIPIAGLIMMFVWGFSSGTNINRRNYARAQLIMALIGTVISIIISIVFAAIFADLFENLINQGVVIIE